MSGEERKAKLAEYAAGPTRVRDFLAASPKEAITFRPTSDDAWTMAEHVHHLLDAEIHGFTRYRRAIAEPASTIGLWDQEGWKAALDYGEQDLGASVEMFTLLRAMTHRHLSRIAHEDWSRYTFVHPERGAIDLDGWLEIYVGHVRTHLDYLDRNLRLFTSSQSS